MKKIFFGTALAILLAGFTYGQNVDPAPATLSANFPPEKIYIHYDKDHYVAGQTIWFKAYLYYHGLPGSLSTNFYPQLTDGTGNVVVNKNYPVNGATATGNIDLPDSLPAGYYVIRALTADMLNDNGAFIYKKKVFIAGSSGAKKTISGEPRILSVDFFPEGGHLVEDILTVVAFKAVDQWNIPMEITGHIYSEDGFLITPFTSLHDGIGRFRFKPVAGKKYRAEIQTKAENGSLVKPFFLPDVKPAGVNLHIEDEKGGKKFQLTRSKKDKGLYDTLILIAQINSHVVYENEISLSDNVSAIGHLLTDSLPSGFLHFTLFNKDMAPLAERISFINNREYAGQVNIIAENISVAKRAGNTIEIIFPENIQQSCSIAITDASVAANENKDNIWSHFLLTTELKGAIYNPAWYFTQPADSSLLPMDNLMLTHGWSRFNWTKIRAEQSPERKYADTYMISLSGTVLQEKSNEAVAGGSMNVFLSAEDSSLFAYNIPVDESGRFRIDSLLTFGKTKIYYTYFDGRGKEKPATVQVDDNSLFKEVISVLTTIPVINKSFVDGINFIAPAGIKYPSMDAGNMEAKLLEDVTLTSKTPRVVDALNKKYTSSLFNTGGKVVADNINYPTADITQNGVAFVLNRISTVFIQDGRFVNRRNFSLVDINSFLNGGTGSGEMKYWPVGLFINEFQADLLQLMTIRADEIAFVKFYQAGFIGTSSWSPGGAIAVYLKDHADRFPAKPNPKAKYWEYNGYSITKEFYNPEYNNNEVQQPAIDNRTTLYWNPGIYSGKEKGPIRLSFYNNDFSKKFRIILEGFDENGKLIYTEKITGTD